MNCQQRFSLPARRYEARSLTLAALSDRALGTEASSRSIQAAEPAGAFKTKPVRFLRCHASSDFLHRMATQ
jgi:hypothetical protein